MSPVIKIKQQFSINGFREIMVRTNNTYSTIRDKSQHCSALSPRSQEAKKPRSEEAEKPRM